MIRFISHSLLGFFALLVLAADLLFASSALAHGGTVKMDENRGPYHVVVVTNSTSNAGELLLTVIVSQGAGSDPEVRPVVGASVSAALSLTGTTVLSATYAIQPEPRLAQSGYYERVLPVGEGDWQAVVTVTAAPGTASVRFPISLHSAPAWAQWLGWASVGLAFWWGWVACCTYEEYSLRLLPARGLTGSWCGAVPDTDARKQKTRTNLADRPGVCSFVHTGEPVIPK